MAIIERTYTIPLRKETAKASTKHKTQKAVRAVRQYVAKHMKVKQVGLGAELNELLWSRGIESPPGKVTVSVRKDDDKAFANLVGKSLEANKVELKTVEDDKNMLQKQVEKLTGANKKEEAVEPAPSKDAPAEKPKATEKKSEAKAEPAKEEKKTA